MQSDPVEPKRSFDFFEEFGNSDEIILSFTKSLKEKEQGRNRGDLDLKRAQSEHPWKRYYD